MVKTSLVEKDLEIGAKLVRLLDDAGIEVGAALWLYSEETRRWKLVIHTPLYESKGPLEAINAVLTVMEKNQIPRELLSSTDVSITGRRNDVIRALHTQYHTGPRDIDSIRLAGDIIDRVLIDEAYVYRVA